MVNKEVIIELYYANWCGHCQKFKPVWDEMVKMGEKGDNKMKGITMKEYNADTEPGQKQIKKEDIHGYPTIIITINGDKEEYNGSRTIDDILAYINNGGVVEEKAYKQCGGGNKKSYEKPDFKRKYLKYKAKYMKVKGEQNGEIF